MEESYFPPNTLAVDPYCDEFKQSWYSKFLKAMSEPTFAQLGLESREVYRFLWLRTFHRPIAVRIGRCGDDCTLLAKELDGAGGYEPGTISKEISRPITLKEWDKFLSLLRNTDYWELSNKDDALAIDGAFWILEGKRNGKYHVVNRHSPRTDGPDSAFREVCLYLLALTGIEIDPSEVY